MSPYKYENKNHRPPAPICVVAISTNLASLINVGRDPTMGVKMIIDTGADMSMIPRSTIKKLESLGGNKLPYDQLPVEDFEGKRSIHKSYELKILLQTDNGKDQLNRTFLEIGDEEGILGRDLLNEYLTSLDGPNLTWTI